jgi:hypothetical protein
MIFAVLAFDQGAADACAHRTDPPDDAGQHYASPGGGHRRKARVFDPVVSEPGARRWPMLAVLARTVRRRGNAGIVGAGNL